MKPIAFGIGWEQKCTLNASQAILHLPKGKSWDALPAQGFRAGLTLSSTSDSVRGMAHILILEDEKELGINLQQILEGQGHSVALFDTATDAIDYSTSHWLDLVIADVFIKRDGELVPDGGIVLVSNLRQIQGSTVPILAISGFFSDESGPSISSTIRTVGASALLAKPFHPDDLIEQIEDLLPGGGSQLT